MNRKSASLILMLCFISLGVVAQSPLIGNWKGTITYFGEDEGDYLTKNIKLKIKDNETAELYFEDAASKDYIPFRRNYLYNNFTTSQIFKVSGNFAYLLISKRSARYNGQEILNFCFQEEHNMITFVLSNQMLPVEEREYLLATGQLVSEDVRNYSGSNLLVGGQSYDYIKISSIETDKKSTSVTFKFTNKTKANLQGTIHEPGHKTAFYITNADRSKKYKLISADKKLPLSIDVKPGGSYLVKLVFEPIPSDMNLMNIFEGGPPEATNLWKFYDVRLKD